MWKTKVWPSLCGFCGSYSLAFGDNCIWQQDKYRITKSPPLLSFCPCQQLNHYSVAAFLFYRVISASSGWKKKKKSVCLCTSGNAIHRKLRPKCEFPAFCEAVHVATSNGRQHCLKKIMCFFPHGFYCQKAVNHSLRNTKDVQWERPMARSAQTECSFLLPFFYFLYCGSQKKL